ncbi:MAG: hypothetical protein CVU59_02120 [Deltaproteobacteria bacterium HGW-Deltaproteobacteria-17]|nr:MAG: hypothetical protein CVU59_02120 [Deltaproteobacteria bacterium HGW-Deltaproteobacteria-17]
MLNTLHSLRRFWFVLLVFGCTSGHPFRITNSMDLSEASSGPKVTRILDLGNAEVPTAGDVIRTGMNAQAVIGELLFVQGSEFGRGPSVSIGGLPTAVLARTENGGILVRVPVGVPAGTQNVVVSTHKGVSSLPFEFRRFAAAGSPGNSKISLMEAPAFKEISTIDIGADPAAIEFSRTKPMMYIVTQTPAPCRDKPAGTDCVPHLLTVDLTLPDFPVVQKQRLVSGYVLNFSLARTQDRALVATSGGLQVVSLEYRTPIVHQKASWTAKTPGKDVLEALISPDGKTAAVLLRTENRLALFDVSVPDVPKEGPQINLLPEEKAPLVKTMAFHGTRSTQTLYVAGGDTPESLVVGWHPGVILATELTSARDRTVDPELKIVAQMPLPQEKVTPVHMAISLLGATEVEDTQRTEWTHFLYISLVHGELMSLSNNPLSTPSGLQIGVELIDTLKTIGFLSRLDHKQNFKSFSSDPAVTGALAPAHHGKELLSIRCVPHSSREPLEMSLECGLHLMNLHTGKGEFRPMGKLPKAQFVSPFTFGAVAVQE